VCRKGTEIIQKKKTLVLLKASIQSELSLFSGVFYLSTFANLGIWVHLCHRIRGAGLFGGVADQLL